MGTVLCEDCRLCAVLAVGLPEREQVGQCQAVTHGVGFHALDEVFGACDDQAALAGICSSLSAADVRAFFDRWQARLPSPFTSEDRTRGYGYELAFRQLEISDTRVFTGRPRAGRGSSRRSPISSRSGVLTRSRSCSAAASAVGPRRFHTKVITAVVEPSIQVHYRASKVKQYFKEGRALRTETTRDFGIGRMLTPENWDALLQIGHQINQRLLTAQLDACQCAPDATTLERVVLPSKHDGLPSPGLPFGEPRTMALLACVCSYTHLFAGLTTARCAS